jgi:hypothetical protein
MSTYTRSFFIFHVRKGKHFVVFSFNECRTYFSLLVWKKKTSVKYLRREGESSWCVCVCVCVFWYDLFQSAVYGHSKVSCRVYRRSLKVDSSPPAPPTYIPQDTFVRWAVVAMSPVALSELNSPRNLPWEITGKKFHTVYFYFREKITKCISGRLLLRTSFWGILHKLKKLLLSPYVRCKQL